MAPSVATSLKAEILPSPRTSSPSSNFKTCVSNENGCINCRCSPSEPHESANVDESVNKLSKTFSKLSLNPTFQALNMDLGLLHENITLDRIPKVPENHVSLIDIDEARAKEDPNFQIHSTPSRMPPHYVQPHPPFSVFPAPILDVRELTKPGAVKRVFHFELDVSNYPLPEGEEWMVGGSFGVMAPNNEEDVDELLQLLHINPDQADAPVLLKTDGGRWPTIWAEDTPRELVTTRRELLKWTVEFMSVAPKKQLIRLLAEYAKDDTERQVLLFLVSRLGQRAFCDLRDHNVTLITLLKAFPSVQLPLDHLLTVLPQLMPRWYSLSNDPKVSNNVLEFAVTVVEINKVEGGTRSGIGSGFLKRLALRFLNGERDLVLPMYRGLHKNAFATHFASDGPMCLIGAGVGVAPFRGFVQRRLTNATCAGKVWVFHGCRDQELDELYHGEWENPLQKSSDDDASSTVSQQTETEMDSFEVKKDGTSGPNHLVVESRSHQHAYVQDEIRHRGDIVWSVLSHPHGKVYLCGGKKGFLDGVENALIDVCVQYGKMSRLEATQQLALWQSPLNLKYIKEIW
ncbi:methionine synthase reductase [Schizosaccharomyces pombe]|uniref:Uncharacterized FAD-binding protein C12C2.03c n=1 Tax=Schizosaccharomyces pombe (strain 972 / ATCC 24843) TaxID=284812 RepID=YB63_SCHPO|nr:putative methionine synthase reductase [Schizosaccharomyces pombe]Q09744.1 RecName: Full=Uncharacterized FAD-binding protein C12C2.03c [Schizosaccharomyces pombe 972h-]CAA90816.1 methionine synthase reductase (predicted) [Schizosaccharomyces pombe]|eukprot:NP_596020.1 putative methionine synthase reductase [Schizosaccharomyces pombe]